MTSTVAEPDADLHEVVAPTDMPWLPPRRRVDIEGVGALDVRDSGGDLDRPAVVLLHGWGVTADLNWFPAYPELAKRYRLISFDHRGHGTGLRPENGIVRLSDCADDVARVLDALSVEAATVAGYSMGGAVAQLAWRRNPDRVRGLVLASTARHFQGGPISDLWYRSYTPLAHAAHRFDGIADTIVKRKVDKRARREDRAEWVRSEMEQVSPAGLLSSMRSLGRFRSSSWIGDVDEGVPVSVVITTKDRTVLPRYQRRLANAIPHARHFEAEGPHDAIVAKPQEYLPTLLAAVDHATPG